VADGIRVLWAVFPLLDQLLEDRPIRVGVLVASYQYDRRLWWYPAEKRGFQMNGMLVSALTGLSVFVMGMIIVHLTPPDDRASK